MVLANPSQLYVCLQAKRTADCVSMSHLDLCVVTGFDFKAVLKDFPHSAKTLKVSVRSAASKGERAQCSLKVSVRSAASRLVCAVQPQG